MPPKDKYTDPELRDQVKQEIQDSDKGGAPGQWSARKAQFMAQEYKKRGGSYNTDKESGQDESQQNLSKWTEEEWQTKEGSGHAKQSDGTRKRYLPKKAWEQMNDHEKDVTDAKKQTHSGEGNQFVSNTETAKDARAQATKSEQDGDVHGKKKRRKNKGEQEDEEEEEIAKERGGDFEGIVDDDDGDSEDEFNEDEDENEEEEEEAPEEEEDDDGDDDEDDDEERETGDKRGRGTNKSSEISNKKQKTSSGTNGA